MFDTNSLISANLSSDSVNRKALDKAREMGVLVYSDETLYEFTNTLLRPKFDKYISTLQRLSAIAAFKTNAYQVDTSIAISDCRDPKDNKFLE